MICFTFNSWWFFLLFFIHTDLFGFYFIQCMILTKCVFHLRVLSVQNVIRNILVLAALYRLKEMKKMKKYQWIFQLTWKLFFLYVSYGFYVFFCKCNCNSVMISNRFQIACNRKCRPLYIYGNNTYELVEVNISVKSRTFIFINSYYEP